jgi:hypothetical protein
MATYHLDLIDDLGILHLRASNANAMVNEVIQQEALLETALKRLREFSQHVGNPAAALKNALQQNTLARIQQSADEMREKFLEIWFSPVARKRIAEMRNELLAKKLRSEA